jgi:hypothetical protein
MYLVLDTSLALVAHVVAALTSSTRLASCALPLEAVSVALSMQSVPLEDSACTLSSFMLRGEEMVSVWMMPLPAHAVLMPFHVDDTTEA